METTENNEVKRERFHFESSYNPTAVFWAFIFISLGVIYLLNSLGVIDLSWNFWGNLFNFWPVVLILMGFSIILGKSKVSKWLMTGLSILIVGGILLMALVVSSEKVDTFVKGNFSWWPENLPIGKRGDLIEQTLRVEENKYGKVDSRKINLDLGIENFSLEDGGEDYFTAEVVYYDGFGMPVLEESLEDRILEIDFKTESSSSFQLGQWWNDVARKYDLSVGKEDLETDLVINSGTGNVEVDLESLKVGDLKLVTGTGNVDLNLSKESLPSKVLDLDTGTGNVSLTLSEEVGLKITYDMGTGFIKMDGETFRKEGTTYSSNWDSAEYKLEIKVNSGTGNLKITRK